MNGVSLLASEPPDDFARAASNRRAFTMVPDVDWRASPEVRWDRAITGVEGLDDPPLGGESSENF